MRDRMPPSTKSALIVSFYLGRAPDTDIEKDDGSFRHALLVIGMGMNHFGLFKMCTDKLE